MVGILKRYVRGGHVARGLWSSAYAESGISRADDLYFSEIRRFFRLSFLRKVGVWDVRTKRLNFGGPLHDVRAPSRIAGKFRTECLLFAEAVLPGQNNSTAALPESSVSGALYMLLNDALHAPEASYHKRTCPSIDGECCVKCALVTKQYCLHRKTVLLLPPKNAEKTMRRH